MSEFNQSYYPAQLYFHNLRPKESYKYCEVPEL